MARQGFMAPAPSHSSSSRDVDAGSRTFMHHESTVSSLHRIAEANIAVEGLRNTYGIYLLRIAVSYPHRTAEANIAGGKAFETREHSSTSALQIHRHDLHHRSSHST